MTTASLDFPELAISSVSEDAFHQELAVSSDFSQRIIAWQKRYGRHGLPWQNTQDPYAIWVSEIMLQQTQVAAVIGYYQRFMQRFPNIAALADAEQDEVMQYWSGLGYYSRARNLHAAARQIIQQHGGRFPEDFQAIQDLPGIGRSTAAAIASFAFSAPHPILDGNVKRVFARHFLIESWPGLPRVEQTMWQLAEQLQPVTEMAAYAQGLMDLGATLCTRSRPRCLECPVKPTCGAYRMQRTQELPAAKPRKAVPEKSVEMLVLLKEGRVLLERRPPSGIWGGLFSLPELEIGQDVTQIALQRFGVETCKLPSLPGLTHTFTHFRLHIVPQSLQVTGELAETGNETRWMTIAEALNAGIPAPVRRLLQQLAEPDVGQKLI